MLKIAFLPALCGLFFFGASAWSRGADALADFDVLWATVEREYAYYDEADTARVWACVRERVRPRVEKASLDEALPLFEEAIESLTDFHAHMNIHRPQSWRLIPSGSDIRAQWEDGQAIVEAVRPRSPAAQAGVRPGQTVRRVGGVPTAQAIAAHLARYPCVDPTSRWAQHWALQRVLAGTHAAARELTLERRDGSLRTVWLPTPRVDRPSTPQYKTLPDGTVVIAITELGHAHTVSRFHSQLDRAIARDAPGLIIDVRETATGGNTSVAEPILARFVAHEAGYQRVLPRHGPPSVRTVKPDPLGRVFDKPVAVVVGPWTASMGEGLAIGLHALRAAPVVGLPMAGLRGAVETFTLPNSGWAFTLPTAKLAHVNGTPREAFQPLPVERNVYGTALVFEAAQRALQAQRPAQPSAGPAQSARSR